MGMTLQLWGNGDQRGQSVLIHLPLVKAPHNIMPINLCRSCEAYSARVTQANQKSSENGPTLYQVPKFLIRAEEALKIPEVNLKKPRPLSFNEDLILDLALTHPFLWR